MAFPVVQCFVFLLVSATLIPSWAEKPRKLGHVRKPVDEIRARIVNPIPPRRSSSPYPFVISLQTLDVGSTKYRHFCGGVILDKWTLLTAAHCFDELIPPAKLRVVAGAHNIDVHEEELHRQQVTPVSWDNIEIHEFYESFLYDNDIAMIHLESPLNYSANVKPIKLVDPDREYRRRNATIMGWGSIASGNDYSPTLLSTKVTIYSDQQCLHQYGDDYHPEVMMCAAGGTFNDTTIEVADACEGDSGGPLVARDLTLKRRYLVGLISWGKGCGIREYPGVYTRVQSFLGWIRKKRHGMKMKREDGNWIVQGGSGEPGRENKYVSSEYS